MFQELLAFAQARHEAAQRRAAAAAADVRAGCRQLPAGLVLAGGVNSADHCTTFPALAAFLRRHGCYVAVMQPASFGRVPGDAIGEVLRQLSGLARSRVEHLEGLAQWYHDETGGFMAAAEQQGQQAQQQEGDSESEDSEDEQGAAEDQAEGRRLRRRQAAGGAAAAAATAAAAAKQATNRQKPLVVIVENTEAVDVQCLRDFVLAASEVRSQRSGELRLAAAAMRVPCSACIACYHSHSLFRLRIASGAGRMLALPYQVVPPC